MSVGGSLPWWLLIDASGWHFALLSIRLCMLLLQGLILPSSGMCLSVITDQRSANIAHGLFLYGLWTNNGLYIYIFKWLERKKTNILWHMKNTWNLHFAIHNYGLSGAWPHPLIHVVRWLLSSAKGEVRQLQWRPDGLQSQKQVTVCPLMDKNCRLLL